MREFLDKFWRFIVIAFVFPAFIFVACYASLWVVTHLYLIPPYFIIVFIAVIWVVIVGVWIFDGSNNE